MFVELCIIFDIAALSPEEMKAFSPQLTHGTVPMFASLAISAIVEPLATNMIPIIGIIAQDGAVKVYLESFFASRILQILGN